MDKDAVERGNEIISEICNEDKIKELKDILIWGNQVAKLYMDNPDFLKNQAKVRGMYLKELRKYGFSRKMAEMIVYEHFDVIADNYEIIEE